MLNASLGIFKIFNDRGVKNPEVNDFSRSSDVKNEAIFPVSGNECQEEKDERGKPREVPIPRAAGRFLGT